MTHLRLMTLILGLFITGSLYAQSGLTQTGQTANDEVATPKAGGHDYQHFLSETVMPSNGSVSFSIQFPMPKGRGIDLPSWWKYNSAGNYRMTVRYPEGDVVFQPNYPLAGPWPTVSWSESTYQVPPQTCGGQCTPINYLPCNFATSFTFTGLDGVTHNLALGLVNSNGTPGTNGQNPQACPAGASAIAQGTDGEVWASFTNQTQSLASLRGWNADFQHDPTSTGPVGAFTVTDKSGTTYFFSGIGSYDSSTRVMRESASSIEDRNGNLMDIFHDTLGRTGSGITYPSPTAPPGAPASTSVSYQTHSTHSSSSAWGEVISCPQDNSGTITGITRSWSGIALPDGTQYTFYYGGYNPNDSTLSNTYGLLNEVTYPNGGWIKYKWVISAQNRENATFSGVGLTSGVTHPGCFWSYSTPMLSQRIVSYDGVNIAQTQSFAYSNPQTGNVVTVQTTDNIQGKSFQTVYTYAGAAMAGGDPMAAGLVATSMSVEKSIQYYDWGNTSSPLKTITKAWYTETQPACELTTINGLTSGHFYKYDLTNKQITDDWEYNFGAITNPSSTCSQSSTTPPTGFARHTQTTYQAFTNLTGATFGEPLTVATYDAGSNKVAETDYAYDGSALGSDNGAVQHDDTNYSASMTSRGNVTKITKKCFTAGCPADSVTTLTYDVAGQVTSVTDPCGNASCADGAGGTTSYFYTDSPSNGNAAGPSDAYITKIVQPQIGTAAHQETFTYNYVFGDLMSSVDQNGKTTTYQYETNVLDRLKETDAPDGGKTTLTYNDVGMQPTVVTSQLISSSLGVSKTNTTKMDGLWHPVQGQLNSDPEGADYTDTSFDGVGRVWKVANPYRTATDGITQTQYDAIGRVLSVTKPDGSVASMSYGSTCTALSNVFATTATDEAGHVRRSCADGLGRLVEVDEPGTTSGSPATAASGSFTISGSEQSVITGPPTAGTGSVTISGTEQSWQTQTSPATSSTGSVTITGSLQSKQVQTQAATPGSASASLNFSGSNVSKTIDPCQGHGSCPQPAYNFGTVSVTVNGSTFTVNYDQNSSVASLAPALGSAMNGTLLNASGGTSGGISFGSKATGASTNYSFSTSTTWYNGTCPDGNPCFGAAPFYFSPTSGALSGGHDAVFTTVYDHGITTITINGQAISYSWSGSGTSVTSIAQGLASAVNSSSSYATASSSGATITLASRTTGASVNYSLSSSSTFDSGNFSAASFGSSNSGGSMTGGTNAQFITNWDSGTTTVTANGHGTPYNWSGSSTTSATIASGLATAINADGSASVNASASGSAVNLTSRITGASTNYSLSASTSQQHGSFSSTTSGGTLTGGSVGPMQYDTGTASVTVGTFTANVSYGQNSTVSNVASALASAFAGSGITATASAATVTLTTTQTGAAQNLPLSDTYATGQPGTFGGASFQVALSGLSLTGGTDAGIPSLTSPAVTLYGYDALNNLTCVVQKNTDTNAFTPTSASCPTAAAAWRPRWFSYDSLSRLLTAINPESGTLTYTYDVNSNVTSKADARSVVTSYLYDKLSRPIQKSYNDTPRTPTVKYLYDGLSTIGAVTCSPSGSPANPIGKRTSMCDAAGSETWSYPLVVGTGWQIVDTRTTNVVTKTITTQVNLDGSVAYMIYPSGRKVTYTPGGAGRLLSAVDTANSINYATNSTYAPFGGLVGLKNGSTITVSNSYDNRQQPLFLSATGPSGAILSVSYDFHLGNGDNGNVYKIINGRDGTRTQNFTYDALNRIAEAWTSGPGWGERFTIDPWSNLTNRNSIPGKTNYEGLNVPVLTTNRLSGFGYDADGNMTSNGSANYTYDAENRLLTSGGVTYTYDGDGNRAMKSNGTIYWGAGPLAESDATASSTSWKEYVFFNGARVARRDASNSSVHYFFANHLRSTSVVTNSSGATLEEDLDYFPYGGIASGISSDHYMFTGKERDTESGLDEFGARYYSSTLGRFIIPDPKLASGHVADPESWNRYNYAGNNPLVFVDLDGLEKQLILYVQQPDPGRRTVRMGRYDYGHTFIGLRDTTAGKEQKIGFYPKSNWDLARDRSVSVHGTFKDDSDHAWTVRKAYTLSEKQYKQLVTQISYELAHPPDYSMPNNNCTTWAITTANSVGLNVPETKGTDAGYKGDDAGDLGQDLRDSGGEFNPEFDKGDGGTTSSTSGGGSSASSRQQAAQRLIEKWNDDWIRRHQQQAQAQ